mmetsp:Transcript_20837/g.65122  ORF Transcript_20837/g.65122 Transcript_20837/m.65122 type:complete len:655 (+) Transcript_20837:993-2957(+)
MHGVLHVGSHFLHAEALGKQHHRPEVNARVEEDGDRVLHNVELALRSHEPETALRGDDPDQDVDDLVADGDEEAQERALDDPAADHALDVRVHEDVDHVGGVEEDVQDEDADENGNVPHQEVAQDDEHARAKAVPHDRLGLRVVLLESDLVRLVELQRRVLCARQGLLALALRAEHDEGGARALQVLELCLDLLGSHLRRLSHPLREQTGPDAKDSVEELQPLPRSDRLPRGCHLGDLPRLVAALCIVLDVQFPDLLFFLLLDPLVRGLVLDVPADGGANNLEVRVALLEEILDLLLALLRALPNGKSFGQYGVVRHGDVFLHGAVGEAPLEDGEPQGERRGEDVDGQGREEVRLLHDDKLVLLLDDAVLAGGEGLWGAWVVLDGARPRIEEEGDDPEQEQDQDGPHDDRLLPSEVERDTNARQVVVPKIPPELVRQAAGRLAELALLPELQPLLHRDLVHDRPERKHHQVVQHGTDNSEDEKVNQPPNALERRDARAKAGQHEAILALCALPGGPALEACDRFAALAPHRLGVCEARQRVVVVALALGHAREGAHLRGLRPQEGASLRATYLTRVALLAPQARRRRLVRPVRLPDGQKSLHGPPRGRAPVRRAGAVDEARGRGRGRKERQEQQSGRGLASHREPLRGRIPFQT